MIDGSPNTSRAAAKSNSTAYFATVRVGGIGRQNFGHRLSGPNLDDQ
jgi:hypothetical protein